MLSDQQNSGSTAGYRRVERVNGAGTSPGTLSAVTGLSIGLKIEGVTATQLQQWVAWTNPAPSLSPSRPTQHGPEGSASRIPNLTVCDWWRPSTQDRPVNSCSVSAPQTWQQCFANSTCEELVSGWTVSSATTAPRLGKHSQPPLGQVYTQRTTLPKILTIGTQTFHLETWVLSAHSTATLQTSATVHACRLTTRSPASAPPPRVQGFLPAGSNFIWSLTPIQRRRQRLRHRAAIRATGCHLNLCGRDETRRRPHSAVTTGQSQQTSRRRQGPHQTTAENALDFGSSRSADNARRSAAASSGSGCCSVTHTKRQGERSILALVSRSRDHYNLDQTSLKIRAETIGRGSSDNSPASREHLSTGRYGVRVCTASQTLRPQILRRRNLK